MSRYFWDFDPFHEFDALQRQLDSSFGTPALTHKGGTELTRQGKPELSLWRPNLDVKETDKEFVLHMDAPGVAEKDININIEDGLLTVSGKRESSKKEENERFHRVERSVGSFSRSMALPDGVDPSKVTASFDNGVLEVRVFKPEAVARKRKISVNVGAKQGAGATTEIPAAQQAAILPTEKPSGSA
eukprot:Mycagemm_TRINITY_DN11452_c0_g1::TRINITY_DN11452_c0_g1_i1::g.2775::m.2775 type:complete len:187 gc:universal TRINITY_DN11452_c0_g1_i1:38-598(+)